MKLYDWTLPFLRVDLGKSYMEPERKWSLDGKSHSTQRVATSHNHILNSSAIPEGTQIYVPPYSLHRDPRYFSPAPDSFKPERWLEADKAMNPLAFIPFSYGPANCIGRQMARQEMLMFASILLQNFTFSFAKGFDSGAWPDQLHDYFVTTRGPLMLHVERRN